MVIAPQGLHEPERRIKGMNRIMHAAINQVTKQETRKKSKGIFLQNQVHPGKDQSSQNQTGYRWHEQSLFVSWVFVVIAVHDINDALYSGIFRHKMKNEAVHEVFKKSPKEHGSCKGKGDASDTEIKCMIAMVKHEYNQRQIHTPDHQGMRFGEYLQVLTFE